MLTGAAAMWAHIGQHCAWQPCSLSTIYNAGSVALGVAAPQGRVQLPHTAAAAYPQCSVQLTHAATAAGPRACGPVGQHFCH